MSSDTITLPASKRELLGKKVKQLRAEGKTPAVVHDHGKDSLHIAVEERELKKVFNSAGKHHPVVLNIDGKKYTTLIKEVTHKPASSIVYHTVFQSVNANETVQTEVPIRLVGEIPAEMASLLVLQDLNHIQVEALPKDLIDSVEIDASSLAESGDKLLVSDLKLPANVTLLTDPESVIAAVTVPKDQIAEADASAAELAEDAGTTEEAVSEDAEDTSGEDGGTDSGEGTDAHAVQPTDEKQS